MFWWCTFSLYCCLAAVTPFGSAKFADVGAIVVLVLVLVGLVLVLVLACPVLVNIIGFN